MSTSGRMIKPLLVGRAMPSDRLGETLPPKPLALPEFASHALSSVAYTPDEILLTLAVAGATFATTHSWQIALAVVLVMPVVVASYRQNVHSYLCGGGDHEYEHLLHNQSALRPSGHLFFTPAVMVTSVPWQMRTCPGRLASVPVRCEGLEEPLKGAEEALEVAIAGPDRDRP